MFRRNKTPKVTCFCTGETEMQLLASGKTISIYECPSCGRLLLRSSATSVQRWYVAEEGGTFCLVTARTMNCPTCQSDEVHIRYASGPWLCLSCRVRDSERELKKEGK